jgi:hypothetical protein
MPPAGCVVRSRMSVPRSTKTAPDITVKAAATDRVMTRRILRAATVRERTAQPSHRGYRPASHMASRNHYDPIPPPVTMTAGAKNLRMP